MPGPDAAAAMTAAKAASPELAAAAALVARFFEAWGRLDAESLVACLHPEISFSDPMFPNLRREQVPAMWQMLIASMALHPADFSLRHDIVFLEERKAQVHWQVRFRNVAGRRIHHKALATLTFWDDRIVRHVDGYPFYGWARQSLGLSGKLLGWNKSYREAVQSAARKQLAVFMHRGS